ncbi:MAG: methionyl-tRNA formyltransferase [Chloroflexi bacterium]|nr:methionyl-tRNA formyltransferase [Chloroflexota bacterium]
MVEDGLAAVVVHADGDDPAVGGGKAGAGVGDVVEETAKRLNVRAVRASKMKDPKVVSDFESLRVDLGVMAFVTDIVPMSILKNPKLGTIQYHPSLLPKHRGGSAINWPIIQGETKTGLTIFWPDQGVDTGPILLQKEVNISSCDTVGSLYYDKLFPLGVIALVEAVELVKSGQATQIAQDHSQATYESLCTEKDVLIKWEAPVSRVYNLIRGSDPRPGATTSFRGKPLKIFDSDLQIRPVEATAGQIVELFEGGFTVAALGGVIRIKRLQFDSGAKISAADFVKLAALKSGDRLGK